MGNIFKKTYFNSKNIIRQSTYYNTMYYDKPYRTKNVCNQCNKIIISNNDNIVPSKKKSKPWPTRRYMNITKLCCG